MPAITSVGLVWPEPVAESHLAEIRHFVPDGVAMQVMAVEPPPDTSGGITLGHVLGIAADPSIEQAARRLAALDVRALAYGCTSGSYVRGPGGDTDIVERMHAATGLPATTTSTATVRALQHLGARRVAVLSPHVAELNARLRAFLEASGFAVVRMVGLHRLGEIELIEPEETRAHVERQVDHPNADAIFISCTGLRSATVIEALERTLGKPVVAANQATMWDVLRLAGGIQELPSRGRLFGDAGGPDPGDRGAVATEDGPA